MPEAQVPPNPPSRSLGDLPMRVVYRALAGVAAVAVAGSVTAVVLLTRKDDPTPTTVAARPSLPAVSVPATAVPATASNAVPTATASASGSAAPSPAASPSAKGDPLTVALADPRVPALPEKQRKLKTLSGRAAPTRGLIKDRRSGVALPRLGKVWRRATANPFASRQVLPKVKGLEFRGMLVSCPVPIPVQDSLRDTALLAARWTLNHHPSGGTITWTASQSIKVGKRKGWLLGYRVGYTIKDKKRSSMAAVALIDVPQKKPALVFITIPDAQKRHWRDINKVMSSLKVL
ncbi:hypothetical protein TBS_14500 [Thermobispora bispora]